MIIIALFLGVVLKKLNSNFESEIGEPIVMVCIVGVIVGIIGIFRFRKSD
jgi:lipopolysaccharide export LptBFGC system permease protein LptF